MGKLLRYGGREILVVILMVTIIGKTKCGRTKVCKLYGEGGELGMEVIMVLEKVQVAVVLEVDDMVAVKIEVVHFMITKRDMILVVVVTM